VRAHRVIKSNFIMKCDKTHTKHWEFSENDSVEKHKKTRKHKYTGKLEW